MLSGTSASRDGEPRIACAFIGLIDTDGRSADNPAYSPAGTQFQESLLGALEATSIAVTHAYALRPVPSFPTSPRLGFGVGHTTLVNSLCTTLLPFVNFGLLKTMTSGIALLPFLIAWAWRHRGRRRVFLLYNLYSPPGFVSVLAGWLSRTHVVAIVADVQVPGSGLLPATPLRWLDYHLQLNTLPLFDGLVVLTRTMGEDFAPQTPRIQLEGAVPEALLPPLIRPELPAANDVAAAKFVVMYAGGLSDLKGVPLLLAAFALLEGDRYELWISGRGPMKDTVRQAATEDPRITYWGFPPQSELLRMYAQAGVLVNAHSAKHTSARYLFPSKLIEYLATGVPVISTCSTPEVAEIYGSVAAVTKSERADEIAALIRHIAAMTYAERRALGDRARTFVLQEKTWAVQAQRISDFVTDLTRPPVSAAAQKGDTAR